MSRQILSYAILSLFCVLQYSLIVKADVDPIEIKGPHLFYHTNGSQFVIRGIYYQDHSRVTTGSSITALDLLADIRICARDIPHFIRLGLNMLVIATVNPELHHVQCMRLLQEAGIYVLVILNKRNMNTEMIDGSRYARWDYSYYDFLARAVDAFQGFSNTFGFALDLGDNEVAGVEHIGLEKTVIRDVKEYISNKKYRTIPVGALGFSYNQSSVSEYLNCGGKESSTDFYGIKNLFKYSAPLPYYQISEDYRNSSIPLFFFYDDNGKKNPDFLQVRDIYAESITNVFSGGVVREWFDNPTKTLNRGLAEVSGSNVTLGPGYTALSSQLGLIRPSSTRVEHYTPTKLAPSVCRTLVLDNIRDNKDNITQMLKVSPNLPVTPYSRLCSCMVESLNCIAGPHLEMDEAAETTNNICGKDLVQCPAIQFNATSGTYGAFLGCSVIEQASWAINEFAARNTSESCSSINGTIKKPTPSALQASDCAVLLKQAGPEGTGLVTFNPDKLTMLHSADGKELNGKQMGPAMQIGIAFGVIFVITFLAFGILVKRAQRKHNRKSVDAQEFQKSELEDNSEKLRLERIERMPQLDSLQRHELDARGGNTHPSELETNERVELGTSRERYELPSAGNELVELDNSSLRVGNGNTR